MAEVVGAELGLQGGVEGFAAVAEELAVVAHLLFGGAFGLLQFLLLDVEGVLGLVGVVYVGEGLQQGLVVLQQGGLQAGVGGLDVGADAAGGEEGELYADAEEAAVAAAGAVEGGEVAVELDAAGLPEELDVEAGEEVGFGAGELGAAGLDFGGAGAQVGALVEEAAGPDALRRAGQVLQQGGLAHGVAVEAEGLRGLADEHGDAALLGVELGLEGALAGLQGLDLGGNGGGVVGGGVAGVEAASGVACQFVQGGELLGNEGLLLLDVGGAQVVFGDLGGDEQAATVELLLTAAGGGAGGIGIAAFLAEDVGLPGGAEAGGGEVAAVAEVGVAAVVAVAFGIGGEAGAGEEVGFGQAGGGAGFFEPAAGDGDAVVVL